MSQINTKAIKDNAVTNAKLAQMPTLTIKGNKTGGTAATSDLTVSDVQTMLGISAGNVTSVGLSDGSTTPIYTISSSPVTSSGTLTFTLISQTANQVLASPNSASGQPSFRALVANDIPNLGAGKITSGNLSVNRLGSGTNASSTTFFRGDATWVTPNTTAATTFNAKSGNYTLALTDGSNNGSEKYVSMINTTAATITIPTNASVAFPVGAEVSILRLSTGNVTISPDSGVTLLSSTGGTNLNAFGSRVRLIQTAANNWVLFGDLISSYNDIPSTSFVGANNQSSAADVTGLTFDNTSISGFEALINVKVIATASLYETFKIIGVQRASDWQISVSSTGDTSGVVFSITTAGQIQYTSNNYSGFTSLTFNYRASATH